jgi:hypothetical protein
MATAKRITERILEFGDVRVPILEVPVDHSPPLILGTRGARAILENLDAIRDWAARQAAAKHAIEQMCECGVEESLKDA